jgi:hypothetical protein
VLIIIDPDMNFIGMTALLLKSAIVVARAFDQCWLCRYPRLLECVHDAGTKFTGFEVQNYYSLMVSSLVPSLLTIHKPTVSWNGLIK